MHRIVGLQRICDMALDAQNPFARHRLGVSLLRLGNFQAAEDVFGGSLTGRLHHEPAARLVREASSASTLDISGLLAAVGQADGEALEQETLAALLIEAKYAGYLARQSRQVEKLADLDGWRIPDNFDFGQVAHLRKEARERLRQVRPRSLGQASRVEGVSPADVTVLMVHLRR